MVRVTVLIKRREHGTIYNYNQSFCPDHYPIYLLCHYWVLVRHCRHHEYQEEVEIMGIFGIRVFHKKPEMDQEQQEQEKKEEEDSEVCNENL